MSVEGVNQSDGPVLVPGRGRWKIGAGILLLAVVAQACFWGMTGDDRTLSKLSVLYVWPAALFLLAIWWTFFSGQSFAVRTGVWGGLLILGGIAGSIWTMDTADGEMVPRFRYRWKQPAKARAAAWLANQADPAPVVVTPNAAVQEPLMASDGDWPGFRGPRRDGIVTGVTLRSDWSTRPPRELWKHPLGSGWSGFCMVGDYAMTMEQRGESECVVCYRSDTGEEVWVHRDQAILKILEINGGDGPHATPSFHDGRLYTLGGTGLLNCLDARTGASYWQKNILRDASTRGEPVKNLDWGMSGSPLIVENLVIVTPGGNQNKSTIAYDRITGDLVWAAGNYPAGYASPQLAEIHGVPQVLVFHGKGLAGHDLTTGRVLWTFGWVNQPKVNSVQPTVFPDGSIFLGCSYGVGSARISLERTADNQWQAKEQYKVARFRPKFNDFVIRGNMIYGLDDGILCCVDTGTGTIRWKDRAGKYGYGQMLLVGEVLLILSEEGDLVQAAASPDGFREITRFHALDPICWNHLAIARSRLLIRNAHEAACYELD